MYDFSFPREFSFIYLELNCYLEIFHRDHSFFFDKALGVHFFDFYIDIISKPDENRLRSRRDKSITDFTRMSYRRIVSTRIL